MTVAVPLRQTAALIVLLVRYWLRAGIAGSRLERFRKGSAFLVRIAVVFAYASVGKSLGRMSLENAAAGAEPVEWLVLGTLGFSACWGAIARGRSLRGMSPPLAAPLVDLLPIHDGVRTFVELLEVSIVHVVVASAFASAAPSLPVAVSAGLGAAASVAASAAGAAVMRWVFVLLPPERTITATQVVAFLQVACLGVALLSRRPAGFHPSFVAPFARPLAGEGGVAAAFGLSAAVLAVAVVAVAAAERAGYDRVEVSPRKELGRAQQEDLAVGPIDELLARREPGGRRWPFVVFGAFILAGFATTLLTEGLNLAVSELAPRFFVGMTVWMGLPTSTVVANRAVTRDLAARPFLSALPLEPRQLLDGKVGVVRRRLLVALFPLAFALLAPLEPDAWVEFAWRSAIAVVTVWTYGSAAVSVAFLVGGLQGAKPQPGGTFRLESVLLITPVVAILFAPTVLHTLVPLACLGLVAFEARRAATRVARWLDDGEDFERETPQWRAALAFAAFQASQVFAARLVSVWTGDAGLVTGVSYAVSALVLGGLSLYGRRDLAPLRIWPGSPLSVVAGAVLGVATAAAARLYAHTLDLEPGDPAVHVGPGGQIALLLALGTFAPVVEELFFRGWLQHVAARDLGETKKWLAPLVAALAFASVHPAPSFPIVFLVGLVTGLLYARTGALGPCIAAHAAHNWGVVLWR